MSEQPVPPRLYKAYINSAPWQIKKWERAKLDRFICQGCGAEDWPLDCHHLTYERLGEEEMDDLVTLCRSCHELVEDNDFDIVVLRSYLKEHEPKPRSKIHPTAMVMGLMLRKPVEMFQQFNKWLAELGEERLKPEDFEPSPPPNEYLFEIGAYAAEVTDEVRVVYDRLIGWTSGVALEDPAGRGAMRADVIRTRMSGIDEEMLKVADVQYYTVESGGSEEELRELAEIEQELVTRNRKLEAAL